MLAFGEERHDKSGHLYNLFMADSRPSEPTSIGSQTRSRIVLLVVVIGAVSVAFVGWRLVGKQRQVTGTSVTATSTAEVPAGDADLQQLVGRWQRPDGGYVLEVRGVAEDGTVEAAYFNPNPISVSVAQASSWRGMASLFVEFDDINYRGSTYQLALDPERGILHGTYYQAALGQTFEVVFVRMP